MSLRIEADLYQHQPQACAHIAAHDCGALAADMGTGKTVMALMDWARMVNDGKSDTLLVVAPNGVHRGWAEIHGPKHLRDVPVRLGFSEAGKLNLPPTDTPGLVLHAITYDVLSRRDPKREKELVQWIRGRKAQLVLDESHRIKTPSANRTRVSWLLSGAAVRVLILSGTPTTQGVEDWYAQLRALGHNYCPARTFTEFKAKYCVMGGFEGRQIIGYRNLDDFHRFIAPFVYQVRKEDCLDLPPKVYEELTVDLSPEQRRIYNQLKTSFLAELPDGETLITESAIVRLLRMQQIICGHAPKEDGTWAALPCPRLTAAVELIEGLYHPAIVWCRFRADVEQLAKALPRAQVALYYGDVSNDDRARAVREFQDGTKRIFLGTAASGGTGLTLTAAQTMIFYSNTFNAAERWQAEDRAHRIGQKNTVTYVDLVAPGTVDRAILNALKRKKSIRDMTFSELRKAIEGL